LSSHAVIFPRIGSAGETLQALVDSKGITMPTIVVAAGCGFEDTFGVFASAIAFQAGASDVMMFLRN
jgi:hypothetical protein